MPFPTVDDVVVLHLSQAKLEMKTRWTVVGRFASVLPFSTDGLLSELKKKWWLRGVVDYKQLCHNRFLLEFEREGDLCFVLNSGPWTHRGDAFLVSAYDGIARPGDVKLDTITLWAWIHDIPGTMVTEETGWKLGKKVGRVVEVYTDRNGRIWGEFIRVRVEHPVNEPLKSEIYSRDLGD